MSVFWLSDEELNLFNANNADEDGLVAVGLDLSIPTLLLAYSRGIFPWFEDGEEIFWFSPDPRMVLYPEDFIISHSLRQTLKKKQFKVKVDTNFREVISKCAGTKRQGQSDSWITGAFENAYFELHREGFAHSFETYLDDRMVGGLYGVSLGQVFFGESMFFIENNASKVAMASLVTFAKQYKIKLIDAQQETPHLKSLGGKSISRIDFLYQIDQMLSYPTLKGNWTDLFAKISPDL